MEPPSRAGGRDTVPEPVTARDEAEAIRLPVLVVLTGPQLGDRRRLDRAIEVGRGPTADLVLRDPGVAWRHARLSPGPDGWTIAALEEAGACEVNGARVETAVLAAGDRIRLGETLLRFELHGPVEQAFDAAVEERLGKDELTGLLSRRKFEHLLAARLDAARQIGGTVGLAVLDLDRLKAINDRHGHLAGARAIAAAGKAIADVLVPGAFACRLGGDEFAVGLSAEGERIEALATAILDAVAALELAESGERLFLRLSAGVAVGPAPHAEAGALLRAADAALLRAKREGGGRVAR